MTGNESLMDIFKDPTTIHSLSFGEKMLGSTVTMIMGLGITFTVLILIWIFIVIMGKVLGAADHHKQATPAAAPTPAETAAADDSLIAVIAAAIAASEGADPDNLVVRRITRLSGNLTPWANAANEARMATRKMKL